MQINIFFLTTGWSSYGITFGLAKRHQKSDEKVSGLDYHNGSLICTAGGLSMEGQPDTIQQISLIPQARQSPQGTAPPWHSC